jgi:hypothetical protein
MEKACFSETSVSIYDLEQFQKGGGKAYFNTFLRLTEQLSIQLIHIWLNVINSFHKMTKLTANNNLEIMQNVVFLDTNHWNFYYELSA